MIKHAKKFDSCSVCPGRRGLVSVGRALDLAFMAALAVRETRMVSRRGAGRRHYLLGLLDHQPAASSPNLETVV